MPPDVLRASLTASAAGTGEVDSAAFGVRPSLLSDLGGHPIARSQVITPISLLSQDTTVGFREYKFGTANSLAPSSQKFTREGDLLRFYEFEMKQPVVSAIDASVASQMQTVLQTLDRQVWCLVRHWGLFHTTGGLQTSRSGAMLIINR